MSIGYRTLVQVVLFMLSLSIAAFANEVLVAKNKSAYLPICVSENASNQTLNSARELAEKLDLITGAKFVVQRGRAPSCIFLSTLEDTPEGASKLQGLESSEAYFINTSRSGVWLCARSQAGVSHAAYDLLHQIGYRRYFPSENWEVIPSVDTLRLSIDRTVEPAFKERKIGFTWGLWKEEKSLFREWAKVNRLDDDYQLLTSHAGARIIRDFKERFKAHPEFFALVKGKRTPRHFCYSNRELLETIGDSAIKYLERHPDKDTFSVEPADGNHWCECEPCRIIGSPSDRLALAANVVGERLQKIFPDKRVAFLAYNLNSPPPTRQRLHHQPTVTATTAFLREGTTTEGNLRGWKNAGAGDLGVYAYPSYHFWGRDMPGTAKMSSSSNLAKALPSYADLGANIYVAESSYNWTSVGFAHYFLSRQLWGPKTSDYHQERADFLLKAFGSNAYYEMDAFYDALDSKDSVLNSSELIHELYSHLNEAFKKEKSELIRRRLAELTAYVRYAELRTEFRRANKANKGRLAEALAAHLAKSLSLIHI